mmetsp:Transcript_78742/g.132112  ORF Transcript_78742/g.132112 Transcript_78742/m.132112 type:complete len:213 (-) Transcript_78742:2057-2695(-)
MRLSNLRRSTLLFFTSDAGEPISLQLVLLRLVLALVLVLVLAARLSNLKPGLQALAPPVPVALAPPLLQPPPQHPPVPLHRHLPHLDQPASAVPVPAEPHASPPPPPGAPQGPHRGTSPNTSAFCPGASSQQSHVPMQFCAALWWTGSFLPWTPSPSQSSAATTSATTGAPPHGTPSQSSPAACIRPSAAYHAPPERSRSASSPPPPAGPGP